MKNIQNKLNILSIVNLDEILYNLDMSVRQIKKSYISCTGYFSSYKNKKQVTFESVLERDMFMLLEFDPRVVSYIEQPFTLHYTYYDVKPRKYTPDLLITYKDKTQTVVEIKYKDELLSNQELVQKLSLVQNEIKLQKHLSFEIYTDEMINKQYMLNLKHIYNFVNIKEDIEKTKLIEKILDNTGAITIQEVLNQYDSNKMKQTFFLPYIWNYVFHNMGTLVNQYEKLTMNSVLRKGYRLNGNY
ncbi:MAG: TnsA endonuclease N-terminal domain-containing protein [Candidatus Marinarcus sp.]|uniref:TnsA endonuclease N-terminal domain-containing protein n=1 Tax=Candidatus Marinarcus sp. TaxID=3100987 RepID=UPI003B004B77